MSASTWWKKPTRLPGAAGTSSPARAHSAARPTAFSSTVLPPAFGPLTTSTLAPLLPGTSPRQTSLGMTSPLPSLAPQRQQRVAERRRSTIGSSTISTASPS